MDKTTSAPVVSAAWTIARVRELGKAERPAGLDGWEATCWYAEQLGTLRFHAETLADEVERLAGR